MTLYLEEQGLRGEEKIPSILQLIPPKPWEVNTEWVRPACPILAFPSINSKKLWKLMFVIPE